MPNPYTDRPEWVSGKLRGSVRLARECNQDALPSRCGSRSLARQFRQIRDEAIADARYWRDRLLDVEATK